MALADLPLTQNKINSWCIHTHIIRDKIAVLRKKGGCLSLWEEEDTGECFHKIFWDQVREKDRQRETKKRGQAERAYYKLSWWKTINNRESTMVKTFEEARLAAKINKHRNL